jgi:hypothetical protein
MSSIKLQSAVAKVISFASINYCDSKKKQYAKLYAVESNQHGSLKHLAFSGCKNQDLRMRVHGIFCPYVYINTAEPGFEFQPFDSLAFYYFTIEKAIEIYCTRRSMWLCDDRRFDVVV